MAAGPGLQTNFADFFGTAALPVLEEVFKSEAEMTPMKRDIVGKVVSHDREIYQYTEWHDLPKAISINENASYTYYRPVQGYDKTLSVVKYGLGLSFSEELFEDAKWDIVQDSVRKMAVSCKATQEGNFWDLFNNGFGSTTTGDGLALFHAAHTTPSASYTIRNKPSTNADLSATSLAAAIGDFESVFVGDSNIIHVYQPKYLVVPSGLRMYAKELVGSELKPDTADNNMNSIKGEGLTVVSSPYLTDTDAWFLCADPSVTGLRIIARKPIETKAAGGDAGFDTDVIKYKARFREQVGAFHPMGVFGSAGA